MRDILIQYPLKVLRLELNKIRLVYANDLKGISKMKKDDIINLLIKYNYDVSNLSAPQLRAKKKTATEKKLIDASKIIAEIPKAEMNASVSINKAIKQKLARMNLVKQHNKIIFDEGDERKKRFLKDAVEEHPKFKRRNIMLRLAREEYDEYLKNPFKNKKGLEKRKKNIEQEEQKLQKFLKSYEEYMKEKKDDYFGIKPY